MYKGEFESAEIRDVTPHEVAAHLLLGNKVH